jgi:hypothetical protein
MGLEHMGTSHFAYVAICLQKICRQTDTIFLTFVSSGQWAFCPQKLGWMPQKSQIAYFSRPDETKYFSTLLSFCLPKRLKILCNSKYHIEIH